MRFSTIKRVSLGSWSCRHNCVSLRSWHRRHDCVSFGSWSCRHKCVSLGSWSFRHNCVSLGSWYRRHDCISLGSWSCRHECVSLGSCICRHNCRSLGSWSCRHNCTAIVRNRSCSHYCMCSAWMICSMTSAITTHLAFLFNQFTTFTITWWFPLPGTVPYLIATCTFVPSRASPHFLGSWFCRHNFVTLQCLCTTQISFCTSPPHVV